MNSRIKIFLVVVLLFTSAFVCSARPMPLDGMWRFALDLTDAGEKQLWFNQRLPAAIKLPGTLQAQLWGYPITKDTPWVLSLYDRFWYLREDYKDYTDVNKLKVPFLSQPPRHYLGVAWYQRDFDVFQFQAARRFTLTLERPHWETTVWIDGKKIGSDKSLVAPHVYELGTLSAGRHQVTIRVDNRMIMPYRPDAHSVSDSLGASWNGIVGRIELNDTGRVWIDSAQVFPDLDRRMMLIKVRIGNQTGLSGAGTLTAIWPDIGVMPVTWDDTGGTAEVEVPIRHDQAPWDEFNPKLHPLRLWLRGAGFEEYYDLKVGLRDFRAVGKEFVLNGRPIIFRGTHSGGDFPLTGYPPTDFASWKKLFETCKSWGLNHMRFHSWTPPEAAFEAADQVGFYLQPEPGMWNEISPNTPMEKMLYEETDRMIKAYGNHPSFMLLSASNEPKGKWHESLTKWVEHYRREDPRRLYTTGTGHTEREVPNLTDGTDYLAIQRIGPKMLRRESAWFGRDYAESLEDINLPVISHEVGQWAAYPDYDVIKKFTGFLKPSNFEIFRDSMKEKRLLEKNKDFAFNSGRFQLAAYKEEIEANLRTRGLSGYQLLDLHDYIGQGTALVGLLDPFWEPKTYVKAEEFKQFSNATVPLARLRQRVFTNFDPFDVDVEVAHFGPEPIEKAVGFWKIAGTQFKGEWQPRTIQIGKNFPLGKVNVDLSKLRAPVEYKLVVTVAPEELINPVTRTIIEGPKPKRGVNYFENEWNFWVFPGVDPEEYAMRNATPGVEAGACPPGRDPEVLITSNWDEAEVKLTAGGRVLFIARNADLDWTSPPLDVTPVFWNRLMNPAWGRMLGLWIDRKPGESRANMLNGFPSSTHFDWQWAEIMQNVRAVNLDRLPEELEPVVWAIDDWNRNYKLGLLFEVAVGRGRLLVSAFDVSNPASGNVVLRQLRYALVSYARSDCFQPKVAVAPEQIRGLLFDTRVMQKLGAVADVNGASAGSAIDGDPNTFMLVGSQRDPIREQVDLKITFKVPVAMAGVVLMSRQNHREHEGDIRGYALYVSDDGIEWREVARGDLLSTWAPQQIDFTRPVTAQYLKLVSLSGFGTDKTTSLAELAVIQAGQKSKSSSGTIEYQRSRSATPDIDEGRDAKPKPSPSPARRPKQ
ncbi:MAG TPA: discoidin domain-containing protein [Pyrinomonadaceae bacterium]|nr:discoidin domain-containing protein [Pyrinomonadaceae bacterium]